MSNPYINALTIARQDGKENETVPGQSLSQTQLDKFVCCKPSCSHLSFSNEIEFQKHIRSHITLPSVIVERLNPSSAAKQFDPLKLKLRLKADNKGSHTPSFEVVPRKTVLLGPGGLYYENGSTEDVKTEFPEPNSESREQTSSYRKTKIISELEEPNNLSTKHREEEEEEEEEEEDRLEETESQGGEEDDDEHNSEGQEEEEAETEQRLHAAVPTSSAPPSPTPSEILRQPGFLAPEHIVDDDSCYPQSLPASPSRMVEMNGPTTAVGSSDNDSGHSRSPAAFTGSGSGSGGDDNSGQQEYNWDDIIGSGRDGSNSAANNTENGIRDGGDSEDGNRRPGSGGPVAPCVLESDPLMLPENTTSSASEHGNLNLLPNLGPDPLQADVDRGDTEYMSLDRLGEASFCCEVCGERAQDRRILEEHRAVAGHYKCLMPECGQVVWSSANELATHQSSAHGVAQQQAEQQHSPQLSTPPQTSPQGGPGTPPVQQLAQQVQRLPMLQQGFPILPNAQYPVPIPQQQLSPQLPISSQMAPQHGAQMAAPSGPHLPGHIPQRGRPPMAYHRMPMQGQPFNPGSPGQQPGTFSGGIQPRPLNTLVAQQPVRAPAPNRVPLAGTMLPQALPRGMAPMSIRGQKRFMPQPAGRGMIPPAAKQRRVEGNVPQQDTQEPGKKSDASAVANILATRGITVTAAAGARPGAGASGTQPRQRQPQPMVAPGAPNPVTTLNLSSAISITPTTGTAGPRQQQQNNAGFAVPQGRSIQRQPQTTNVERPPRPPTVDLTGDGPPLPPGSTRLQMTPTYHRGRGRPSNLSRATCQICDKAFSSPEMLAQHMAVHRTPGKLPYRCNLCNAQYPTQQGLQQHRQTYHKEAVGMGPAVVPGEEMVIPLVDLKQPGVAARLSSLGIHHCIPLSGLGNQSNGYFSLPVVSIDGSRTSAAGNLRSLGASGVLSIGPIKLVPR